MVDKEAKALLLLLSFGRGARSQKVSGTKKKIRKKQRPTIIATILKDVSDCLELPLEDTYQNTHRQPRLSMIAALTSGTMFLPPSKSNV